jgi:hypothetical protein
MLTDAILSTFVFVAILAILYVFFKLTERDPTQ